MLEAGACQGLTCQAGGTPEDVWSFVEGGWLPYLNKISFV